MEKPAQYSHCLVLAGGGFRFGYYLGVHAAAEASGRRPDLLLATCGGAMAAAVIGRLPDAASRRDWVAGPAMYEFLRAVASSPRARPRRVLGGALLRWLDRRPVPHIPDLFDDYLFDLPAVLPLPPPGDTDGPALAIVGGRLLFDAHEVGIPRGERALFEETVFGPERAGHLLHGLSAPAADRRWSGGAMAPTLRVDSVTPVEDAVRISIADMFYFRCHAHGGHHYTGGVVDLFPIELAQRLARDVVMERKAPFGRWLAEPALRRALGIDGAARLRHVHGQSAAGWVDTTDVSRALRGHGVGKRIDWCGNRIVLRLPDTLADYAASVQAQWAYGYQKGMAAYA